MSIFNEKLAQKIEEVGNSFCLGLDFHKGLLPKCFSQGSYIKEIESAGNFILEFFSGKIPAVKIQVAFMEALGWRGIKLLEELCHKATNLKYFLILDMKRGDISSTMTAYGEFAFEILKADAITVTPYMGLDVLVPLKKWLVLGKGVYVVWISSNKSGDNLQQIKSADGRSVAQIILSDIEVWLKREAVIGSVGLVVGATKLRELAGFTVADHFPLLLPGVGAQGASINSELIQLVKRYRGSLIPISRAFTGIGYPDSNKIFSEMLTENHYAAFLKSNYDLYQGVIDWSVQKN